MGNTLHSEPFQGDTSGHREPRADTICSHLVPTAVPTRGPIGRPRALWGRPGYGQTRRYSRSGRTSLHSAEVRSRPATWHAKRVHFRGSIGHLTASPEEAITRSPSGAKCAARTPCTARKVVPSRSRDARSHTLAVWSPELAARRLPSGENETGLISCFPTSIGGPSRSPSWASRSRTVPSFVPAARSRPSAEKARLAAYPSTATLSSRSPRRASQISIGEPGRQQPGAASLRPSGLKNRPPRPLPIVIMRE